MAGGLHRCFFAFGLVLLIAHPYLCTVHSGVGGPIIKDLESLEDQHSPEIFYQPTGDNVCTVFERYNTTKYSIKNMPQMTYVKKLCLRSFTLICRDVVLKKRPMTILQIIERTRSISQCCTGYAMVWAEHGGFKCEKIIRPTMKMLDIITSPQTPTSSTPNENDDISY